jgi:hypothetical protein
MNVRLMRGQVCVREVEQTGSSSLWTPEPGAREQKTHTGRVLTMGPPARLHLKSASAPEVPYGFEVGALVQFHYEHHQEAHTRTWVDGEPATWVPQSCIDGVWEE